MSFELFLLYFPAQLFYKQILLKFVFRSVEAFDILCFVRFVLFDVVLTFA